MDLSLRNILPITYIHQCTKLQGYLILLHSSSDMCSLSDIFQPLRKLIYGVMLTVKLVQYSVEQLILKDDIFFFISDLLCYNCVDLFFSFLCTEMFRKRLMPLKF